MLVDFLLSTFAHARRLLADRRDTAFVEYSSLALLIAMAALAVFTEAGDGKIPN